MVQVKIFKNIDSNYEYRLNSWLEEHPNIKIHNIKFGCPRYTYENILIIFYEEQIGFNVDKKAFLNTLKQSPQYKSEIDRLYDEVERGIIT